MELEKSNNDSWDELAISLSTTFTNKNNHYYHFAKTGIDFILSILSLVIVAPLILFFAILIKIESPGPAFYYQERAGHNGKIFKIIKLRSMLINAEDNGAQWAIQNDPRVTKIGAFIRKTRIDELPQLINIIKGEMCLIGPRPERPMFTIKFNDEIPGFINRLSVKPGVTGWAQINGGYDITPEEKLKLDLHYIRHCSISMDLFIFLKTIKVCITGDGAR